MRSLILMLFTTGLLPVAVARPFVGVLLWSWISFMNPHQMAWGMASATPWAALVFCATILGCVVRREPKRFPNNSTVWLIIAFIVCISLASLAALAPPPLVEARWAEVSKSFLFLVITIALLTDRYRIHALLWIMVISLAYFGIRGGGFTLLTGGMNRVYGPPSSMIGDNNTFGVALLVTLPLMNYLRLRSAHRVVRVGLVCAMLLSLFAIIGTYSRGALLGLGAVMVLLGWRSSHRVAMLLALGVSIAAAISFMPTTWVNRMATLETYQEDGSAQAHLSSWQIATAFALARPLTGAGFMGSYTADVVDQFDPGQVPRAVHSIYLEVLGENGFPAFFVWLGISLVGIANTRRIIRQTRGVKEFEWARDLAKMAQVSIVAYLVAGAFVPFSYWDFYFTMLVAVAATRERVTEELAQLRRKRVALDPFQERLTATPVTARALHIRQWKPSDG